jgi:hypothetical protein
LPALKRIDPAIPANLGTLKPGRKIRVPMMMRDHARDDDALHRPGFRYGTDEQQAESRRAYDEMVRGMENAWKSPERIAADTERAAEPPLCEDAREDAYQRYKNWLVNAWRGSR